MFTGLVEEIGEVVKAERGDSVLSLHIAAEKIMGDLKVGDSVSVSGICLTIIDIRDRVFVTELVPETVSRTSVKSWKRGTLVNLERALAVSDRLGGHIVQGHVDGVSRVIGVTRLDDTREAELTLDPDLSQYVVEKGSIALDGVSLTVARRTAKSFTVCLIPKTLEMTTLGSLADQDETNVEVDILAKYVAKLMEDTIK